MNATAFSTGSVPSGVMIPLAYSTPHSVATDASQNSVVLYPGFIVIFRLYPPDSSTKNFTQRSRTACGACTHAA